jgi:hypothetical protein
VKIGLIGCMMLVSVLTVYVLRPRLRRETASPVSARGIALMDGLFFWLRVNPVLGMGVLLATSVMFYFPVPPGFGPKGPSAYTTTVQGLTASVSLNPDTSGPHTITVKLTGADRRPVSQASVTTLTTVLNMVMGTGIIVTHERAPGTFSGAEDLGMGGPWRLTLLVYRPGPVPYLRMYVNVQVGT